MTSNRSTNDEDLGLDALLSGTGLPEEFTPAGGAIGRRLWPDLVEIRTQAGGTAVVMARLAIDGPLLYQVDYGLKVCAARGLTVGAVIASIGNGMRLRAERPDLQLLDVILRRSEADTVWWRDVERIARDRTLASEWLDEMGRLPVDVIIGERLWTDEPNHDLLLLLRQMRSAAERQHNGRRRKGRRGL